MSVICQRKTPKNFDIGHNVNILLTVPPTWFLTISKQNSSDHFVKSEPGRKTFLSINFIIFLFFYTVIYSSFHGAHYFLVPPGEKLRISRGSWIFTSPPHSKRILWRRLQYSGQTNRIYMCRQEGEYPFLAHLLKLLTHS